jgi:Ca2+-binding EF-hand superfamily protein
MCLWKDTQKRSPQVNFDTDTSGKIDRRRVCQLMKKLTQSLTDEEIDAIMDKVNNEKDNDISLENSKQQSTHRIIRIRKL